MQAENVLEVGALPYAREDVANDPGMFYDVAIVGGGIIGASLLYTLAKYTNVSRLVLLEKRDGFALVNSSSENNSQTLHFGDIETNYTLEKAGAVKEAAELLAGYLERYGAGMFRKESKIVLGVGKQEVRDLEKRYEEFEALYPKLRKLAREEIAELEPSVVARRDPRVPLLALATEDGYAVDYGKVTESFIAKAREAVEIATDTPAKVVRVHTGVVVAKALKAEDRYVLQTSMGDISARVVVFAAGPYSLTFAKALGYGTEFGILPVAGNFYGARNVLRGKVYMMQIPGMPFAAVHGDPNVNDPTETRFGPTIRLLPLLERHNYLSFRGFLRTSVWTARGVLSLLKIALDPKIIRYAFRNILFDLPCVGKRFFTCLEICKIVPSLSSRDVTILRGKGGIRPQVVNTKTGEMEFGESEIVGDNILFNITPSPGASVCLKNAEEDAEKVVRFLGSPHWFDKERFCADLALPGSRA